MAFMSCMGRSFTRFGGCLIDVLHVAPFLLRASRLRARRKHYPVHTGYKHVKLGAYTQVAIGETLATGGAGQGCHVARAAQPQADEVSSSRCTTAAQRGGRPLAAVEQQSWAP